MKRKVPKYRQLYIIPYRDIKCSMQVGKDLRTTRSLKFIGIRISDSHNQHLQSYEANHGCYRYLPAESIYFIGCSNFQLFNKLISFFFLVYSFKSTDEVLFFPNIIFSMSYAYLYRHYFELYNIHYFQFFKLSFIVFFLTLSIKHIHHFQYLCSAQFC